MSDIEAARALLVDGFGRIRESVADLTTGLTDETAWWRPDEGANSIAWLLWHLIRVEDDHISDLAGAPQSWPQFRDEAGLPLEPDDTGYGHTAEQVAAVRVSADLLDRYHAAVHLAVLDYLGALTEAELQRIVDHRWDPPVTAAVRLVSVLDDCARHVGQAEYVRGLADRRNKAWTDPEAAQR
ncbi:hypothetical protein MLP_04470 [Microlunatus phosphovorus NM-1]|uniref:DinB-like domain-containing protein n=1 Tax=Microlunatus phosphovorus (strain ATCC 700054 / DSM 10555 / JCM 9379 / NBRC 101784 / NCIMB 13414 / VKM Ac-1990 / NM-1) TaxID=1032480 RepID=F5XJW5_MICPN|nr:DUF664 domain-containing protein [Microlunatus phosphovorus]BAK33461.1 hypothetical protein MLP_04470 [Microlunatus phosphovorus NM-1]